MDLDKIKLKANDIKNYADLLVAQDKAIVGHLTNIYNVVALKDALLAKRISDLIGRYKAMIESVAEEYTTSANQMVQYVNHTDQNLNDLESNLTYSVKMLNDVLSSVDKL